MVEKSGDREVQGERGDMTMEYKDVYTACDKEHRGGLWRGK